MESLPLTCAQARWIDLVDYLGRLGHQPHKIKEPDYWYLSPLRAEKKPSFKVNRKLNLWYDHGSGKGGTLVDFAVLYHHCSIREALHRLTDATPGETLSFHPPELVVSPSAEGTDHALRIQSVRPLESLVLLSYLRQRQIPL